MQKVAIIGAGLAGLTAAHTLKDHAAVTVFEKSRGYGGRMATRYADPFRFDHGTQFFKARSKAFQRFLSPLITAGVVQPWHAKFVEITHREITKVRDWDDTIPHYTGVPGMNAVGMYLKDGLDIRLNTKVTQLSKDGESWILIGESDQRLGAFDWVIVAIPAQQATALIPSDADFYTTIKAIEMDACFALMLGFSEPLSLPFDAALVKNEDISWVSVNHHKPQREQHYSLLVQSTNIWANAHIDDDRQSTRDYLRNLTSEILGVDLSGATHQAIHGWRYANIDSQVTNSHYLDQQQQIAVCGDWLLSGRVESAFKSGLHVAERMVSEMQTSQPHLVSHA